MFFLWFLSMILSTVSGVWDLQCEGTCSCCIDGKCEQIDGWLNGCTIGCIDGHRGARCYEMCQYENCISCGGTGNSKDCTECYDGHYLGTNKDCTPQCPSNCKSCISSTMCTRCKEGFYDKDGSSTCKYARCPTYCECNGQGDCVSCKTGYFDTSTSCTKRCPVNCVTCESENSCNACKNGFHNGYEYDNSANPQLNNCTYACRDTCTQCQSYNNCTQCINGKYGSTCQEDCSVGCKDKTCLSNSGYCACKLDFTGDACMQCVHGNYGSFCNETCPKYCKEKKCAKPTGYCSSGCVNDNISGSNCSTCNVGRFGELCDKMCPKNCKDSRCERYSGLCSDGCTRNFKGTRCDQCISGNYGKECELNCPINCANNVCDRSSGICLECVLNFQGQRCDECKLGYYDRNCDVLCPLQCANYPCNRNTGNCVYGCKNGYSGDKCCVMSENCVECQSSAECRTCVPGFFKSSCNETCPGSCAGSCDISTGECILSKEPQQQKCSCPVATAAVLGAMFTLSFAVNIVLLVLYPLKKIKVFRRKHNLSGRSSTYENHFASVDERFPTTTTSNATDTVHSEDVDRNVYDRISNLNENEHDYQKVSFDHGKRL